MKMFRLLSLILVVGIASTAFESPNVFAGPAKIQNLTLTSNVTLGNITCTGEGAKVDDIQGSHIVWKKGNAGGTDQLSYELCENLLQAQIAFNKNNSNGDPTVTLVYSGSRIVGYSELSDPTGLILEQP